MRINASVIQKADRKNVDTWKGSRIISCICAHFELLETKGARTNRGIARNELKVEERKTSSTVIMAFAAVPAVRSVGAYRQSAVLTPLRFRPRTRPCRGCIMSARRDASNGVGDESMDSASYGYLPTSNDGSNGGSGREAEFQDSRGEKVGTLSREAEKSFDTVLQELVAIQQDGPRNVAILGTRYTSYLHQQIIELLTYANVLVGNHVFTSGAGGTNAAVIRGALRAERPHLLTVVLPQSLHKQPAETQEQVCWRKG